VSVAVPSRQNRARRSRAVDFKADSDQCAADPAAGSAGGFLKVALAGSGL